MFPIFTKRNIALYGMSMLIYPPTLKPIRMRQQRNTVHLF